MFLPIWLFNLITSLMFLQHYCIISLLLVSVTRSLSHFLVIVVTISVSLSHDLCQLLEDSDGSKNSKTGILDSGRVISVFRVISPVFKRWLHFGKLRVPSFFITKFHRSIKMDYKYTWIIINNKLGSSQLIVRCSWA